MTNELRTNDEPQRILLEASERIKACYPDGTKIEAQIGPYKLIGEIQYIGMNGGYRGNLFILDAGVAGNFPFSPAVHPHRVLP